METLTPPNLGPTLHVHQREDENFYIVEGDYLFEVDGRRIELHAGDFAWAPRGVPHCFQNIGSAIGRMLITVEPAGIEDFFGEIAAIPGPPIQPRSRRLARSTESNYSGRPSMPGEPHQPTFLMSSACWPWFLGQRSALLLNMDTISRTSRFLAHVESTRKPARPKQNSLVRGELWKISVEEASLPWPECLWRWQGKPHSRDLPTAKLCSG